MKKNKINFLIFVIILCILISIILIKKLNTKITPIIMEYSVSKARNYATNIINESISKIFEDDTFIYTIEKDISGNIKVIDYNYIELNKKLYSLNKEILDKLKNNENDIYEVSIASITNNIFLSNIGKKIPVKLNMIGYINSNIETELIDYGINNALMKIYIKVEMTEEVIMPFLKNKQVIEAKIPLSIKMIEGNIPKYYGGHLNNESNLLSLPIDEDM